VRRVTRGKKISVFTLAPDLISVFTLTSDLSSVSGVEVGGGTI